MVVGTAGFTAMLRMMALEHMGLTPSEHEVAVTGAAGKVAMTGLRVGLTLLGEQGA